MGFAPIFAFVAGVFIICLTAQGQATQLAFVQPPSNTLVGSTIAPPVTVAVEDVNGNVIATDNSNVTVAIGPGSGSGTLNGTLTVTAVNGLAPFNNLSISAVGTYTLQATDGALAPATSPSFTISAAVTLLHSFQGGPGDGSVPLGDLTLSGSKFYGMTNTGGAYSYNDYDAQWGEYIGYGTVFSMNTDGTGFTILHSFAGGADGASPWGNLTLCGSTLYGMTCSGGASGLGTVFSINTDGTGYTILHSFAGGANDGGSPKGSLTLSGMKLYGVTYGGGADGSGTVFSINTDGTGFNLLFSSFSITEYGPFGPVGELALSGATLYGMTFWGAGDYSEGTIYSINTDGTNYATLFTWDGEGSDGYPQGSLTLCGTTLYGMTGGDWYTGGTGGPDDSGTVFSIQTDGTGFTWLYGFGATSFDGNEPHGSLTLSGSTLYGMTTMTTPPLSGVYPGIGTVFSINTDDTGYTILHSFAGDATEGADPNGSLTMSGSMLYGMTSAGGSWLDDDWGWGTVFSLNLQEGTVGLLTVQSTPPTGLSIGSSTGHGGTTSYAMIAVATGTTVNLQVPATDPAGYTFSQWTVNGAAQTAGQKSITFTFSTVTTAVAQYTLNPGTLLVESTPPTGLGIGSSTGDGATTNCTITAVAYGTSVNLQAPVTDPNGYIFSQWTVNGTAQTAGQKSLTFTMTVPTTAVAQYTPIYTLNVQSTPPTGLGIASGTGDGGTTNYTVSAVPQGTTVNLVAPAIDPAGYTFWQWTVNGVAQTMGLKSITFAVNVDTLALAQYTQNPVNLTVQSTPLTKVSIGSSTYDGGTTDYTIDDIEPGTSVDLEAPPTDPTGYTFLWWVLNGAAQTTGQKSLTFTMTIATTAVAQYSVNAGYTLSVQSMPLTGIVITSSAEQGGRTDYTRTGITYGTSVNLQAPVTDPSGYVFSQWALNGAAQTAGQKSITFTMTAGTTAAAVYAPLYTLSVQSTPPTGLSIGSSAGDYGATNYTDTVVYGTSVDLEAPATDPAGYTFSQWTVNGAAQSPGQKSITFTMDGAVAAVAHYTANVGYMLTLQSTPPTGLSVGSSSGHCGTTNCAIAGVCCGTSVNLAAPEGDPAGYSFSEWTLNGAAQAAGEKSVTFTMDAAMTAVAHYTPNMGYALTVQSTPPTGLSISSSTGQSGTTNYKESGVAYGASVNLQAPATDPAGYTFLQWTVNGAAQSPGQKAVTFTMDGAATAVAEYTSNTGYALTVESTPRGKQVITSSTFDGGMTTYTVPGVAYGANVNLQAPATDPTGYTFSQWKVNGAAQAPGQKSITFMMDGAVTAVAEYTANTSYALTVQSTPPTGLSISSSTGQNGTTNYTKAAVGNGTDVNLQAPATDPKGYTFSQWTVNGAAQSPGQKSVTFTMAGAVTAVAEYTVNAGYLLTVQSMPPTGLSIGSSTGQGGTTNFTKSGVGSGTNVNLQAPATDPKGYTFLQWTVNGAAQSPGQKSITFAMDAAVTAVAQYTVNTSYTLTVQSTPPTGLVVGSSTGQNGKTNCTKSGIAYGTSVNLQAPATDPTGYTFWQWTVNGMAQTAGQKSVTFTMDGGVTAVAVYSKDVP